jgi:hypothetical protein
VRASKPGSVPRKRISLQQPSPETPQQTQARALPAALPARPLLLPADFRSALTAAGIEASPSEDALFQAAFAVAHPVHGVVSAHFSPRVGQIRAVGETLEAIEQACLAGLRLIIPGWPGLAPPERDQAALRHALGHSRDPVIVALLDAAAALDRVDARELAKTLHAIDRLGAWAGAAGAQYAAGLRRERVSREDPAARSPARALGFALIDTYVALTGADLTFGRPSPKSADRPRQQRDTDPTGPLVRYLAHLFARARATLAADPELAGLAQRREWNPTPETLAEWIGRARKNKRTPDL